MLSFSSDYMEGAYPSILNKLLSTNLEKTSGYGLDSYSESAREKIKIACNCPDGEVFFLGGGTQTNALVIDSLLRSYQGVLTADTGHISVHEAGAIEYGGHKVLTLPQELGKITAEQIEKAMDSYHQDVNCDHMVMPGMVYLSHPTEYGTLYSKSELTAIHEVCRKNRIPLYLDGARLAYALATPENELTLQDLAELCDIFYIGGTKCGALFGEAVVIPKGGLIPHFFSIIKQHGALFAKGRILGIQFDELFCNHLYENIGASAISLANQIRTALKKYGYQLYFDTPTNQIFVVMSDQQLQKISEQVEYSFWEKYDASHTVIRFATSWATTQQDVDQLIDILQKNRV